MSIADTLTQNNLPLLPMAKQIAELLAAAPKRDDIDRPALECHVVLRGQFQGVYGVLSYTDGGLLKMMTRSKVTHENQPEREIMLEQFFHVSDVTALMVEREIKVNKSHIILG